MEKIGKITEFEQAKCVTVKGKDLAVFKIEGKLYCMDNTCPHAGGPLCEGEVGSEEVICPWHGWTFNVKTGNAVTPAYAQNVTTYKVEVKGDDVFVEI